MKTILFVSLTTLAAAFPSVGPDYVLPATAEPGVFRDTESLGTWKTAEPADAFSRGEWWKAFNDPVLDDLETRALSANQDLHATAARVEQARALAGVARSAYWPQVGLSSAVAGERGSLTTDNVLPHAQTTTYRTSLDASWEIDLFGRVRRENESARAAAEASASNFEAVKLALTAEVASTYFSLRAATEEWGIVADTVSLRRRALDLVNARRRSGSVADLDVARAETELASTEAESAALANRRATIESALAVLVGESAAQFSIVPRNSTEELPSIPAGLTSELLERRPDIAAAERALAAASARIGVAKAAFFPAISLTGSAGYASGEIDSLVQSDSRIWSIGPKLYLPIFQGGRNRANLARSRAAYDEAVAVFRGRVLIAFREVQDALSATRYLTDQTEAQQRATAGARRAADLAQTRYDAGYVSYLEVIDAQRTALASERAQAQLRAQRLLTRVALIKSLGGGWQQPLGGADLAQR